MQRFKANKHMHKTTISQFYFIKENVKVMDKINKCDFKIFLINNTSIAIVHQCLAFYIIYVCKFLHQSPLYTEVNCSLNTFKTFYFIKQLINHLDFTNIQNPEIFRQKCSKCVKILQKYLGHTVKYCLCHLVCLNFNCV